MNRTSCLFGLRFAYLHAVIFFAFFLLVVRFGRFCRLSRKWEDLKCTEKFLLYLKTPNLVSVNQYNNLDVLLKNRNELLIVNSEMLMICLFLPTTLLRLKDSPYSPFQVPGMLNPRENSSLLTKYIVSS